MNGSIFYLTTLLVYVGVDVLACLGLSIQYGVAGVTNFGFIIFQAAGAYTAGVLSLPDQSSNGAFQSYIGGLNLPFPLPIIGAAIVGGLIALPFTFIVGKRLRGDFAAIGLLVAAVMANLLVTNFRPFMNGSAGLSLVPAPLQDSLDPQSAGYQIVYAIGALVIAGLIYLLLRRVTESPYGRSLRAMRENDIVADSLGKNLVRQRTAVLVLGGAIAGLSGGLLVGFINLWAPSGWGYAETIVIFAAVIIGGAGNHKGAALGAIIVPVLFEEVTRFIPAVRVAWADPSTAVGCDRRPHRRVPVVPPPGDPARATESHSRVSRRCDRPVRRRRPRRAEWGVDSARSRQRPRGQHAATGGV